MLRMLYCVHIPTGVQTQNQNQVPAMSPPPLPPLPQARISNDTAHSVLTAFD